MHLQLGEVSALVVSSPEIAREVMKTHDTIFAQRPPLLSSTIINYNATSISFSPYGEYWRQLRKICTIELLSAKRVKSFQWIREEEGSKLIRSISLNAGSLTNLTEKIFSLTYGITSRAAFGKKFKDQDAFVSAILEAVELSAGFCVADMFPSLKWLHYLSGMKPKLEKVHQKIDRILHNIIDVHRKSKATIKAGEPESQEDLVDVLLNLQEHGDLGIPLTDDNVKAVLLVSTVLLAFDFLHKRVFLRHVLCFTSKVVMKHLEAMKTRFFLP